MKGDLQKYLEKDISGSVPTIQSAKKRNRLTTKVRATGSSEVSSTTAATADGTEVPYKSRPTQQAEQKSCKNYSTNIIPTPTYNNQHSPGPTSKQQPLQLQQQPLQLQPYSRKYTYDWISMSHDSFQYEKILKHDLKN